MSQNQNQAKPSSPAPAEGHAPADLERIAAFEIERTSGAYEWLVNRPDVVETIKDYLTTGGTLKAIHRWLVADHHFPFSHSRLDATIFRIIPRPRRV